MLLVFIKQVVEDLLVKEGDAFEIVTRARLKTDNLIDESVRLVGQVGDVLLPLNLLLNVGGIVPNLQLDSVEGGLLDLLETLDGHVNELFGLFLADLVFKEETSTLYTSCQRMSISCFGRNFSLANYLRLFIVVCAT